MAKKAFCVGINDYPGEGNDLNGCVNDATGWAALLVDHFDFPRTDVRVLTDAQATKRAMLDGIEALLAHTSRADWARPSDAPTKPSDAPTVRPSSKRSPWRSCVTASSAASVRPPSRSCSTSPTN